MDFEKLRELIQIFEKADISEIEIEDEGGRIVLKKPRTLPVNATGPLYTPGPPQEPQPIPPRIETALPPATRKLQDEPPTEKEDDTEGLVTINAPMVGVFYAAPAPGEPPFVRAGDMVEADQTVCIVEAMKLMNEVTAKFSCVIERVLVENAEPVEFGQPLFAVRPLEQE